MRPADDRQKRAYRGVYPLAGFITVNYKLTCVEFVGDVSNRIKYEVIAPDGYHFDTDGTHTILCANIGEVDACSKLQLAKCTVEAGCDVDPPAAEEKKVS